MADKCGKTMAAISENRRDPLEGQENTVSQDRSAVGTRKPIVAGKLGDIKGVDHMRDDSQTQPDSTGGRNVMGRTGRAGR
jgi:hypothetical protein